MWYRIGLVSVENNSNIITGSSTFWYSQIKPGDIFKGSGDVLYEIRSIQSDTQITLVDAYIGSTQSNASYSIIRNFTYTLNADIANSISNLVSRWRVRDSELTDWSSGTADGGPSGNGEFPLTGPYGAVEMVASPSKISYLASGSEAAKNHAEEWASKAEDFLVSIGAGADGANDYSALHWAKKAEAFSLTVATLEARVSPYYAKIQIVSDNIDNVNTVSDSITNVNVVAPSIASVNTVADSISNVDIVAPSIASVNTVAAGIDQINTIAADLTEVVSEINTVADDLNEVQSEINTVAESIDNVDIVGADIDNVNTTANSIVDVNATAANITDINTVAISIASVNKVTTDIDNVNIVAMDIDNVNTVSSSIANVNIVAIDLAEPLSEINTVATDIDNVNTVGADIDNINAAAESIGNVNTVASVIANVNTTAANITNVNKVAVVDNNVTTVANSISNVNTTAANIVNVNKVATIDDSVVTVAGIDSETVAVSGIVGNVTTVAGNIDNVNKVSVVDASVTAVAAIDESVTVVASNTASVSAVAESISSVNTNAANISDIQSASANALLAKDYAVKNENVEVEAGKYSALHWATKSAESASVFIIEDTLTSSSIIAALSANQGKELSTTKVDNSRVLTDVPANAVFTDTEKITSLNINANILTYIDEEGTETDIDLSLYLDDTNLARLTTGTLNGSTGVATFTREDSTTFTVDFSALLDDTVLSDVQVKDAYERNLNTNTFTDTEKTKLNSIETGATTDQTKADIDALNINAGKVNNKTVEANVPTGAVFTDTQVVIQDNLTSTSTDEALSANQGKELKTLVDQSSGKTEWEVTQAAHGFSVLDVVYVSTGTWAKAKADNTETLGLGVVTEVIDTNTFKASLSGFYEASAHGLTVDEFYYLSDSIAGGLTSTEPDNSQPVLYVVDANNVLILPYRPSSTPVSGYSDITTATGVAGSTTVPLTYTLDALLVFCNGVQLGNNSADDVYYEATNGTSVIIHGTLAGDSIRIISFGDFEVADAYTKVQSDANYATQTDLSLTVQASVFRKSVIALCELTNDNANFNSYSSGELIFHRVNSISPEITCKLQIAKQYNTTKPNAYLEILSDTLQSYSEIKICTFMHNGVKYGGLHFYQGAPNYHTVIAKLAGNFDVFGLDYYDTQNSVALNTEVNDSLSFTDYKRVQQGHSYNQGNILGTVSQSAGIPTGAVIERGSNDDGEYVKFADGTLICACTSSTSYITDTALSAVFYNNGAIFTYPCSFIDVPVGTNATKNGVTGSAANGHYMYDVTVSGCRCGATGYKDTCTFRPGYTAIGRWF